MHAKLDLYAARHGELEREFAPLHSIAQPTWAPELKATTLDPKKWMFPVPHYDGLEDEEILLLNYLPDVSDEDGFLARKKTWATQKWEGLFGLKSRAAFLALFNLLCVHVMGASPQLLDMLIQQPPFSSLIDKFLKGDLSKEAAKEAIRRIQATKCTECGKQVNRAQDARCLSLQAAFFCSRACEETGKEKHNTECPHGWLRDLPRGMEEMPPLAEAKFGFSDTMSSEFRCWCNHKTPKTLHGQFVG